MVQPEKSEYYKALGRVLRITRKKTRRDTKQLAETLHLTQPIIARCEAGKRPVDAVEFVLIARALGLVPSKVIRRLEREMFPEHDQS